MTVVSYLVDDDARGITVNSFTSVSLDPPLVLVSIAERARAYEGMRDRPFAINILSEGQEELALYFADRLLEEPDLPWIAGGCAPRLASCIAWIECRPWARYRAGDHDLVVGEVTDYDEGEGNALVFDAGVFRAAGKAVEGAVVPASELQAPWLEDPERRRTR